MTRAEFSGRAYARNNLSSCHLPLFAQKRGFFTAQTIQDDRFPNAIPRNNSSIIPRKPRPIHQRRSPHPLSQCQAQFREPVGVVGEPQWRFARIRRGSRRSIRGRRCWSKYLPRRGRSRFGRARLRPARPSTARRRSSSRRRRGMGPARCRSAVLRHVFRQTKSFSTKDNRAGSTPFALSICRTTSR